jgi:hypothetical protein
LVNCAAKLSIDEAIEGLFSYIFHGDNKLFVDSFFQKQNLEQGYTGLFWEQNREYSFFTHI